MTEEVFADCLDANFTTILSDGTEVELIPNGRDVPVTFHNRHWYVELVLQCRLKESAAQLSALVKGFHSVVPPHAVSLLTWQQLEVLVCGKPDFDLEDLKATVRYEGISPTDIRVQYFWQVCALTRHDALSGAPMGGSAGAVHIVCSALRPDSQAVQPRCWAGQEACNPEACSCCGPVPMLTQNSKRTFAPIFRQSRVHPNLFPVKAEARHGCRGETTPGLPPPPAAAPPPPQRTPRRAAPAATPRATVVARLAPALTPARGPAGRGPQPKMRRSRGLGARPPQGAGPTRRVRNRTHWPWGFSGYPHTPPPPRP